MKVKLGDKIRHTLFSGEVCVGIYAHGKEPLCFRLNFARGRVRSRENIRELASSFALYRTLLAIDEWSL